MSLRAERRGGAVSRAAAIALGGRPCSAAAASRRSMRRRASAPACRRSRSTSRTGAPPSCSARTSTTPSPATATSRAAYRLNVTLIEKRYPRGLRGGQRRRPLRGPPDRQLPADRDRQRQGADDRQRAGRGLLRRVRPALRRHRRSAGRPEARRRPSRPTHPRQPGGLFRRPGRPLEQGASRDPRQTSRYRAVPGAADQGRARRPDLGP